MLYTASLYVSSSLQVASLDLSPNDKKVPMPFFVVALCVVVLKNTMVSWSGNKLEEAYHALLVGGRKDYSYVQYHSTAIAEVLSTCSGF